MTQNEVAQKLGVSFQAVSLWERGETSPDIEKLKELANVYQVSVDWLLTGTAKENLMIDFQDTLSDLLFDESRMYTYVKTYALAHHMDQTVQVLPYVRAMHEGQFRKGKDHVPYIYHPLLIACHALALGLDEDDLISTALLHDVCEDCGVEPDDLPVNENTRQAVLLLTNQGGKGDEALEPYFEGIASNRIATMVKVLDRCNNVSGMAAAFSQEKMAAYIRETEKWVYPLLRQAKERYPMYSDQLFLIKYHMTSVVETIRHLFS
ncbi:MAG: helix-turn-helix domain-containing protein [Lachnospiraceae bacterium]|nr:helix-turn-helix domain-containing protein [Lachnospiraceae bacterium]